MPYSKAHKQQSRERILRSAMKLFTRRGFEGVSIDEVMADAELTRGAFYAHFNSKQELYAEAIAGAAVFSPLVRPRPDGVDARDWLARLLGGYLHRDHVLDRELPCPLAFLATDVAVRDPGARKAYTGVYLGLNKLIRRYTRLYESADRDTVLAVTAMMIGGVAVARALDDGSSRNRLLKSCRAMANRLLGLEK